MNEQKQEISPSNALQLKAEAGLKRVFNPEQRSYFIRLKEEMRTIANGRTPLEMRAEKDLKALKAWTERKRKAINFLETKKIPASERNKTIAGQIEMASEKLGWKDVLGPEEVEKTFGIHLKEEEIPEIPFSEKELERAAKLGQMLVLRVDKTKDGRPMSLKTMNDLAAELGRKKEVGVRLLARPDDWIKHVGEESFANLAPRAGWALVTKEILPGSANENYLEQTEVIIDYIQNKIFGGVEIPEEYAEAIAEFKEKKEMLKGLIESVNWQKGAELLPTLEITRLTRPTCQEIIYDLMMYYDKNQTRLMIGKYTYSASASLALRNGVIILNFSISGVLGDGWCPAVPADMLGSCFSRCS